MRINSHRRAKPSVKKKESAKEVEIIKEEVAVVEDVKEEAPTAEDISSDFTALPVYKIVKKEEEND